MDHIDVDMTHGEPDLAALEAARFPYPFVRLAVLLHQPFFGILRRDPDFSLIRLSCGSLAYCLTHDLAIFADMTHDLDRASRRKLYVGHICKVMEENEAGLRGRDRGSEIDCQAFTGTRGLYVCLLKGWRLWCFVLYVCMCVWGQPNLRALILVFVWFVM
jgi:hypothetical protein